MLGCIIGKYLFSTNTPLYFCTPVNPAVYLSDSAPIGQISLYLLSSSSSKSTSFLSIFSFLPEQRYFMSKSASEKYLPITPSASFSALLANTKHRSAIFKSLF